LRQSGFLACGIGLPVSEVDQDMNGLRIGTPELVRWGMKARDADRLAGLIQQGMQEDEIPTEVAEWRSEFNALCFVHSAKKC
jgi:glycine hydroxymethyltransferase